MKILPMNWVSGRAYEKLEDASDDDRHSRIQRSYQLLHFINQLVINKTNQNLSRSGANSPPLGLSLFWDTKPKL